MSRESWKTPSTTTTSETSDPKESGSTEIEATQGQIDDVPVGNCGVVESVKLDASLRSVEAKAVQRMTGEVKPF